MRTAFNGFFGLLVAALKTENFNPINDIIASEKNSSELLTPIQRFHFSYRLHLIERKETRRV